MLSLHSPPRFVLVVYCLTVSHPKNLFFQADTGHWHNERRRNSSGILCRITGTSSKLLLLFQVLTSAVAFPILCDASPHCVTLESLIGPYWPKACDLDWFAGVVYFDVLLWSIEDLLGIGNEVSPSLVTRSSP